MYQVVVNPFLHELTYRVTELMHMGWKPTGGIFIDPRSQAYYQAMVKEIEKPNPNRSMHNAQDS